VQTLEFTKRGWTLSESVRRCVSRRFIADWLAAEREARRISPSRIYIWRNEAIEGAEARIANQETNLRKAIHDRATSAAARLQRELWKILRNGRMVAFGRRGSPMAPLCEIPASAWKILRLHSWKKSVVREPEPLKTRIFDVQLFPILKSPCVARILNGKTFVEAAREYVLFDPQVHCLREHAIACGGEPISLGCGVTEKMWPVLYGLSFSWNDPDSALLMNHDAHLRPVRAADLTMASRFHCLITLLASGKIEAIGVPATGGPTVVIPRSMWSREHTELDLTNGDLGEFVDDPASSRLSFRRIFSALMLQQPALANAPAEAPALKQKPKNPPRVRSTIEAENACRQWLMAEMAKSPDLRPKPKPAWLAEARARWPGKISKLRFNSIWAECIAATGAHRWGFPGAPKRATSPAISHPNN
jgi:hypothetical protein